MNQEARATDDSFLRRVETDPSFAKRFVHDLLMFGVVAWAIEAAAVYLIIGFVLEWSVAGAPSNKALERPGA